MVTVYSLTVTHAITIPNITVSTWNRGSLSPDGFAYGRRDLVKVTNPPA